MATRTKNAVAAKKTTAVSTVSYEDEVAALAKRLQMNTGDRIKINLSKFFEFPDGSTETEIEGIVLDFVAHNRYYTSSYNPNSIVPPECFALGLEPTGLIASDNSPEKQCASCAACWANQFGSAQGGKGKGKACSNTRILALVIPPKDMAVDDDLSELPIYTLSVSPTALKAFDGYVGKVAAHFKKPVRTVFTHIGFDPGSDYPSLRFAATAPAGRELEVYANSRLEEARQRLMVEPDVSAILAANEAKVPPKRGGAPARARAGARR